ncbi:MAG: NAD-dependent succinate-semialdehyde dehydrogenase [Candidatus Neomarinimicrobiota bacterium]|uniref:Aldehyde dehydrogenase domain-containing protein n=1 Tax=marine metagenome TaxID=408172 RepID=A0A381NF42_9ZZZZ|nr:NAD-dependent succinate-semialdehyde dehydrogenase [Candidatus Neomarinimicrobiota bacterium]
MNLVSINPANNKILESHKEISKENINQIINSSYSTYLDWRNKSISYRSKRMRDLAELLKQKKEKLGALMTQEMGKPIKQSIAEAEKCAWVCEYYADNAKRFLSKKEISTDSKKSFISFQPIGLVLAIMPWNFPFWQVFRFASPTLMAGNVGILKHASNVQGCAKQIEKLFLEAGFPEYTFSNLVIGSNKVSNVINNSLVRAVTLTGSTPAGKSVASLAGSLLKKTVLELGGNDPYIILEDADLNNAVESCIAGRMLNTGQSCIAAKRFIVVKTRLDEFIDKVEQKINNMKMGDPLNSNIDIGPMVNTDARDELHQQVLMSIEKGAKLISGGKIPESDGSFYPPTLLTNVEPGMSAFDDELFGPVAVIISAKDQAHAIDLANKTNYGLGAAIFTGDIDKGEKIAINELEAGSCFVNDFVKSDPRLPFGGIKESGYGRELSEFGILEFVNIKSVVIQ